MAVYNQGLEGLNDIVHRTLLCQQIVPNHRIVALARATQSTRRMLTYLDVPEMSGKIVGPLTELESDYFMHCWRAQSNAAQFSVSCDAIQRQHYAESSYTRDSTPVLM